MISTETEHAILKLATWVAADSLDKEESVECVKSKLLLLAEIVKYLGYKKFSEIVHSDDTLAITIENLMPHIKLTAESVIEN